MKKIFKTFILTIFIFSLSITHSFAASSNILPEGFNELSLEEQHRWFVEHAEGMGETYTANINENIYSLSANRATYGRRIPYSTSKQSVSYDLQNRPEYGFTVAYRWSVDSDDIWNTLEVNNVEVIDVFYTVTPITPPTISTTGGVVENLGHASYTTKLTVLTAHAVYDLFQHATLLPQGTYNIWTVLGETA